MSYLGLTPTEHSSGNRRIQGSITKAGNSYIRRLLVESSWHDAKLFNPNLSKRLMQRRQGQSVEVINYADKAGRRLVKKFRGMAERGKPKAVAVTALAREKAGFIWGMMTGNYDIPSIAV